jgi:hypothetical protein
MIFWIVAKFLNQLPHRMPHFSYINHNFQISLQAFPLLLDYDKQWWKKTQYFRKENSSQNNWSEIRGKALAEEIWYRIR